VATPSSTCSLLSERRGFLVLAIVGLSAFISCQLGFSRYLSLSLCVFLFCFFYSATICLFYLYFFFLFFVVVDFERFVGGINLQVRAMLMINVMWCELKPYPPIIFG
jgi:hypothetical protein